MLFTSDDFRIKAENFDLTKGANILRIICGGFMFRMSPESSWPAVSRQAPSASSPKPAFIRPRLGLHRCRR